nr:reverse transcriptase domain-containing protein [Tanacetum cinerariifolium]
ETTDTELPSTKDIQPPLVQVEVQVDKLIEEPFLVILKAKANLPFPSRLQKEKLREKDDILDAKFMEIFRDLHFELSFADALVHMPKFAPMFKKLLNNKNKLIELTKMPLNEKCSTVVLKKLPEKLGDPGRFLIPCDFSKFDNYLALADLELADRTISKPTGVAENVFVKVSKFYFPADFVVLDFVADHRVPLILGRPFLKVELKELPPHLEYAFLGENEKWPVIILKDLSVNEKSALINVLKSRKKAIAWKLTDIKGIDPEFCSHKILLEDDFSPKVHIQRRDNSKIHDVIKKEVKKLLDAEDFSPKVQSQRRVNLKIHDVIKKEPEKLLDAGLIYPISDSPWEFDFKVIDTKGVENYAVDHLSRLENPYKNVFDPNEINETFPLESL